MLVWCDCTKAFIGNTFSTDPETTLVAKLRALLITKQCCHVVVGWPLESNGQAGQTCRRVSKFCRLCFSRPLHYSGILNECELTLMDERGTTVSARQLQTAANHAGAYNNAADPVMTGILSTPAARDGTRPISQAQKKYTDSVAATLLLQSWLHRCV